MTVKLIRLLFVCYTVLFARPMQAQQTTTCGTDDVRRQLIEQYPEIIQRERAFNIYAQKFDLSQLKVEEGTYIIPVVFHVIHDYGVENISDEQIFDAMEKINEDFNKENSDLAETVTEFLGIAADVQVEFRLAQRELSGACTNGIDRIPSMRTYTGGDAAKLGGWQHGFYLNIWVVKFLAGSAAAYAYYPTSIFDALAPVDGVICRYDYVGSIGAAGEYSSHTLSHEIGHYLNLQHTWGNTNNPGVECGDDQVDDTPVTKGWLSCNLAGHTCIEPLDNVQNFMEYSYCSTMFTEGQKTRMYAALNSTDAQRNHLWSSDNLMLTGTNDGYVAGLCSPEADFYTSQRFVCKDESVTFHDVSWRGDVDSRMWTFEGGSPLTSTEMDPVVSFNTPGWHSVTLQVTNASGTTTKTVEQYIYVSDDVASYNADYVGNFNNMDAALNDWVLYNRYPDNYQWNWRGQNGYWNTPCIWLNSRFGPDQEKDEVISPSFDLSDGLTDNVFFKYSTTSNGFDADDYTMKLKLYYSTNCAKTWISVGEITGDDLITSYGGSSNFFPVFADQWRVAAFSIPSGAKAENVRFKIEFVYNNYVNNVFVDDFNFTDGTLGIEGFGGNGTLAVTPNITGVQDVVSLHYTAETAGIVQVQVSDITGRVITTQQTAVTATGPQTIQLNLADLHLSAGCYFVTLHAHGANATARLVLQ